MTSHSFNGIRAPRLNPFAFPSDTSFRFALLVVFVVCGSSFMYGELWSVFSGDRHLEEEFLKRLSEWMGNQRFFRTSDSVKKWTFDLPMLRVNLGW